MSNGTSKQPFEFYPDRFFRVSPTWNSWVKIRAADVHALREVPDNFRTPRRTYFHLNHPIRFVRLVGPIVAIDDINSWLTTFTIDDGSGATIEVAVRRLSSDITDAIDCPSNTVVDNVHVDSRLGVFDLRVDETVLDIGTVVNIKCTLTNYRKMMQLELQRVKIVRDTTEEARAWGELADFYETVLGKPWVVTAEDVRAIEKEERREAREVREKERKLKERNEKKKVWKERHEERMKVHEEKLERRRKREEDKLMVGALV
ncbi:hypothetical protein K490DRAFT_37499 [Saccharata proteae CBS 121410]|uniref:CST complex subunit Stn1 N-terminal domain-containing protein n=1 Tax=Saccharata proteae CBS 121410 TaxID=1314787 RepID=A0A6A5YEH3_9PEZI|nr:hypothetical protein K490DRAFT_37499 [Saccharata proteae CBS 121410]